MKENTPNHPIEELLGEVSPFLEALFSALGYSAIYVSDCELDHICYRVKTQGRYQQIKSQLAEHGELLTETIVGGRNISTYKLTEPIRFGEREIYCIELPSPKEGSPYKEGFEHIEFVIDESFDNFMSAHPNIDFKTRNASKPINPDISVQYSPLAVKFHHKSLEEVIEEEQES